MDSLDFETCYSAIQRRDQSFEGSFFFAVKTTGIFCRPTCTAKRALKENITFFDSSFAALKSGYRPCKVCKPLEMVGDTPVEISTLLDEINLHPDQPIKDQDLRARGLKPETVRRWFKKHHGMTFQAYQRMLRLNRSYQGLVDGHSVTSSAFDVGYESLSGFNTRFKEVFGVPPSAVGKSEIVADPIFFERFPTKLGPMMAGSFQDQLCLLEFTDRRGLERELIDLKKRLKTVISPGSSAVIAETKAQIAAYFNKQLTRFSLPLMTPGTAFQQKVWQQLITIPYGETRSYKRQAELIGKPRAVRAVATANGMNRISIIIPCHRVIGSDGSLTGYAGGLARKEWLLALECG